MLSIKMSEIARIIDVVGFVSSTVSCFSKCFWKCWLICNKAWNVTRRNEWKIRHSNVCWSWNWLKVSTFRDAFSFFFFFEILTFQSSQIAGKITGNKMHVEEINKLCSYFWRIYKRDVVKLQFSDKWQDCSTSNEVLFGEEGCCSGVFWWICGLAAFCMSFSWEGVPTSKQLCTPSVHGQCLHLWGEQDDGVA